MISPPSLPTSVRPSARAVWSHYYGTTQRPPVPSSSSGPPLMAVHAQYLAHAAPDDPPRHHQVRPAMDNAAAASVFLGEPAGNTASGDLTYTHSHSDGGCVAPPLSPVPRASAPAADARSRLLRSAAASTSGRPPAGAAPQGQGLLLPHDLYRHGVEVDALIRIESERLRAALWDARRLRAAEAELARALARNAELDERLRQAAAEGQAWRDAARSHEAAAAGLRAALDDLARQPPPCAEGDAESCCSEAGPGSGSRAACRSCGDAEACVLLLPCRHLCLCRGCELAGAEACPVCFADRNASLHVLLLPCDGQ